MHFCVWYRPSACTLERLLKKQFGIMTFGYFSDLFHHILGTPDWFLFVDTYMGNCTRSLRLVGAWEEFDSMKPKSEHFRLFSASDQNSKSSILCSGDKTVWQNTHVLCFQHHVYFVFAGHCHVLWFEVTVKERRRSLHEEKEDSSASTELMGRVWSGGIFPVYCVYSRVIRNVVGTTVKTWRTPSGPERVKNDLKTKRAINLQRGNVSAGLQWMKKLPLELSMSWKYMYIPSCMPRKPSGVVFTRSLLVK